MNFYIKKPFGPVQNKQYVTWQKIAIGLFVLALVLVTLNTFSQQVRNTFYYATLPVSKVFWQAGDSASGFFASFLNAKALTQENNNLKQENQNLLSQISFLQETIKADQSIKEVIANTQSDNFKMVLAEVIGLDAANDVILLNRGYDDSIAENMPVISSTKVLFGKVVKVYKNFSQVVLISNKNSVVDAQILSHDPTQPVVSGAVKGNGNLSLYLDLVASDAKMNSGDVLMTSGLEGIFPKNLLIGKIISSKKNDLKPFQTAQVQPFFDIKNIDNVFIIIDYKKTK